MKFRTKQRTDEEQEECLEQACNGKSLNEIVPDLTPAQIAANLHDYVSKELASSFYQTQFYDLQGIRNPNESNKAYQSRRKFHALDKSNPFEKFDLDCLLEQEGLLRGIEQATQNPNISESDIKISWSSLETYTQNHKRKAKECGIETSSDEGRTITRCKSQFPQYVRERMQPYFESKGFLKYTSSDLDIVINNIEKNRELAGQILSKTYDAYLIDCSRPVRRIGGIYPGSGCALTVAEECLQTIEILGHVLGMTTEETYQSLGTSAKEIKEREAYWQTHGKNKWLSESTIEVFRN